MAGNRAFVHLEKKEGGKPFQDHGQLRPGGGAAGDQGGLGPAGDKAIVHRPGHGGPGVGAHLGGVGIAGEAGLAGGVVTLIPGVAVEQGGQLLPGDRVLGPEASVVIAQDDALLRSPGHRLGVPGAGLHVGEAGISGRRAPCQTVEDGGSHAPADGQIGGEEVGGGAGHPALFVDIGHSCGVPGAGGDIGKGTAVQLGDGAFDENSASVLGELPEANAHVP